MTLATRARLGLALLLGCAGCPDSNPATPDLGTPRPDAAAVDGPSREQGVVCHGATCLEGEYCHLGLQRCVKKGRALCDPVYCTTDEECGLEEDRCQKLPSGEPFCSRHCTAAAPCPPGYSCKSGQCFPDSGLCDHRGQPCSSDLDCFGRFDLCLADSFGAFYCSRACTSAADCPTGFKYCALDTRGRRLCHRKLDASYAACGRHPNELGVGAPCSDPAGCAAHGATATCLKLSAPLPASFCSKPCATHADCGTSAYCAFAGDGGGGARCVPYDCACGAPVAPYGALLDKALAKVSRDVCDLGHRIGDPNKVYSDALVNDPLRLTVFNRLYYTPMAIPGFRESLAEEVQAVAGTGRACSGLLRVAARLWDEPLPADLAPRPAASFEDAVLAFHGKQRADGQLQKAIAEESKVLPLAVRQQVAPILSAMAQAILLREEAIGYLGSSTAERQRLFRNLLGMFFKKRPELTSGAAFDLSRSFDRHLLVDYLDYGRLIEAAVRVCEAVERSQLASLAASGSFRFNHMTPYGRIVIGGSADDSYLDSDPSLGGDLLFLLDTGGNDTYQMPVGATSSVHNPISVAIDLDGKDRYTYHKVADPHDTGQRLPSDDHGRYPSSAQPVSLSEHFRQGAGNLGVGLLWDMGGDDDTYESLRFSQGSGLAGVGVLIDDGGDDYYAVEAGGQGAAHFGVGLLADLRGNDTYRGYSLVQGAAYVKAVGLLVDFDGDDRYWSEPGNSYIRESKRLAGHDYLYSHGASQGAAWGRRGDYPIDGVKNNVFSSGGAGILIDLAGADQYTCGAFCQGTGYWFGLGLLADQAGSDRYDGRVYNLGSAAHFGIGIFHDASGDEQYLTGMPSVGLSIGFGHDFSVGWHSDAAGNDTYHGAWASFGYGTNTALGVLVNLGGNDTYQSTHFLGFGVAANSESNLRPTSPRYSLRTTGVFADGGGTDSYSRKPFFTPEIIGDGKSWLHPHMQGYTCGDGEPDCGRRAPTSPPAAYGVGIDQ